MGVLTCLEIRLIKRDFAGGPQNQKMTMPDNMSSQLVSMDKVQNRSSLDGGFLTKIQLLSAHTNFCPPRAEGRALFRTLINRIALVNQGDDRFRSVHSSIHVYIASTLCRLR